MLAMLCYAGMGLETKLQMSTISDSDRVREYAAAKYVGPARAGRQTTIRIQAGEVQKGVHLSNRTPLVCQALKSHKFLNENGLVLEKWDGPQSGMSTTVVFTYRLLDREGTPSGVAADPGTWAFSALRGVAAKVFGSLGGGEAFLREERNSFYGNGKDS